MVVVLAVLALVSSTTNVALVGVGVGGADTVELVASDRHPVNSIDDVGEVRPDPDPDPVDISLPIVDNGPAIVGGGSADVLYAGGGVR